MIHTQLLFLGARTPSDIWFNIFRECFRLPESILQNEYNGTNALL